MTTGKRRACKDCEPGSKRPAPHPGPRCASHHRVARQGRRDLAWERRLWETYHITPAQYWAIYEAQGRCCYLCRRAKGTGRKKLSVDHDHSCCPGPISCGRCVRGLLCSPCNRDVLGHFRDEVAAFQRGIDYLTNPPAWRVLRESGRDGDRGGQRRLRVGAVAQAGTLV